MADRPKTGALATSQAVAGERAHAAVEPFSVVLDRHELLLRRDDTQILQINVGLLCNQVCRHCHLDAAPNRHEVMDRHTMEAVTAFARRGRFACVDLTGGAPEMFGGLTDLVARLAPLTPRLMLRFPL